MNDHLLSTRIITLSHSNTTNIVHSFSTKKVVVNYSSRTFISTCHSKPLVYYYLVLHFFLTQFKAKQINLSMSIGDSIPPPPTPMPLLDTVPFELKEQSDFDKIVTPDGMISICGFGSLLSERSARSTFPDLINFRIAKLSGFRRVFAHVAPIFFQHDIARPETKEISSLSVEPCEGESIVVTVFEIQRSEIPAFIEREHEFRFLAVTPETFNGLFYTTSSIVCARYSDEEYFINRCRGSEELLFQRYGRFGIRNIWADDILPCRAYLRHCVLAAKNLSDMAYVSFLDHTFLGDRRTTIREYLETEGSGIMEEDPPEGLKERYGG